MRARRRMSVLTWALTAALVAGMVLPAVASAAARVRLRVEGQNATIFTGNVTTAQTVITDSVGATHTLDGKALCALDEAARLGAFTYVVKDFGFGLLVDAIAGEANPAVPAPPYPGWVYRVNMTSPSVGAGDYEPADGDEVLFAYGPSWDASPTSVRLSSSTVAVGTTLTVTAMQHDMGGSPSVLPEAIIHIGSTVATADANGVATLRLTRVGAYGVRTEKDGYIRSAVRYARALFPSTIAGFVVGPTPVRPLTTIIARGRLVSNGAALRGRLVRLERAFSLGGPWQVVRVTSTRADGTFVVGTVAGRTAFYRSRFFGDATHLPVVSAPRRVLVVR